MPKKREDGELDRKTYAKELRKLQEELCYLQDWARETGGRIRIKVRGARPVE